MPARVAGFSERSGRVISTCECGFGEKDLGSGESLDDVHGALAERARPGRVKRHLVCKPWTIEKADENSNGIP